MDEQRDSRPFGTDAILALKTELRAQVREARRALSAGQRMEANAAITERALQLREVDSARSVLAYEAIPEEVDPTRLVARLRSLGSRVALPRIAAPRTLSLHWVEATSHLAPGAFDILEPSADAPMADPLGIDFVIVPGVAFDRHGHRLGFGGGFYDDLLPRMGMAPKIALAFDEQVVDHVPADEWDVCVDVIVTPTRLIITGETPKAPPRRSRRG